MSSSVALIGNVSGYFRNLGSLKGKERDITLAAVFAINLALFDSEGN